MMPMMPNDIFTQLNELIIHVTDVELTECLPQWSCQPQIMPLCQIWLVHKGTAIFELNGETFRLGAGHLLFLSKGQKFQAASDSAVPLIYFAVSFTYQSPLRKTDKDYVYRAEGDLFPLNGEVPVHHHQPQVLYLFEQLYSSRSEGDGGRQQYRQKGLLHELLYLAALEIQGGIDQQRNGVERTVEYMHQHYTKNLPLEELSGLAGFSPSYYSRLFKKLKGLSPNAYMTKLRMNRAKELLVYSQNSYYEIAQYLGYKEESYFSRMFKKETGYSPTEYVKMSRTIVVTMRHSFNGDFLALGIRPHAAVMARGAEAFPIHSQNEETPSPILVDSKTSIEDLVRLKPTLILCDEEWAKLHKELSHAAPTVTIPYWDIPWRERLYRIADLVGRRKEAKTWLQDYEQKAERASQLIKANIGEATILVLRIVGGKLRVYGMDRNIGCTLYQDLKLTPPQNVRAIKWRKTITLEELPNFDANYVLLMGSPHKKDQKMKRKLVESAEWQDLTAVKNNQCIRIALYPWIDYSASSHELVIDEAVRLFVPQEAR
ncbi:MULTISPECIES: AraC family transcriptional regulator [unclassified Paenibacillus]|uniref:AraC family transcriptional regulator n=1 Tax=unclassified Paenibacillus TaxID=185978 RepID=UPI00363F1569